MLEKNRKIGKNGEYILVEFIGAGAFGDVWKAEKHTALTVSEFALKFFRPKSKDDLDLEKIRREVQIWQRVNGLPNIISVIEADIFENYIYIVSDYADGGSLDEWLNKNGGKAETREQAIKFALDILKGLDGLHKSGFVHRDVKPANILIRRNNCCLADFGVTREIKSHSKATGTAGTLEYMPPEAFSKNPIVSPQTDIWAVGVILQELLTGKLPYPQDDIPSLMAALLYDEPEAMSEETPLALREIVKKALQKDRKTRFKTAQEMIDALKNPDAFLVEIQTIEEKKKPDKSTIIDEDFDEIEILHPDSLANMPDNVEGDDATTYTKSASDYFDIALACQQKQDYVWAIRNYTWAIELNPNYAVACHNRGIAYSDKGDYDHAIRDFNKAIELNPHYADAYCNRGLAYYKKGDYDRAIKDYNKVIELDSNFSIAYYNRGLSYLEKDHYDRAIADFKIFIELNPNYGVAYKNRGNAYRKKGDYERAIKDYNKAIELNPNDAFAHKNRGLTYYDKGDYDTAIRDYAIAIELNPNDANAYNSRGLTYYNKGDYDQAHADYNKAIKLNPNFELARKNRETLLKR